MANDRLKRLFKDEAAAVYAVVNETAGADNGLTRYIVSTRDTRNLMNYPEIINCDFTKLMSNGITNALKALNVLEGLSCIGSRTVNVCHILRGGLNFQVRRALNNAFGYKWHSSSYVSSQRVLMNGKFEITENAYRKFEIPDQATLYTADIVASGSSLNDGIEYVMTYLAAKKHALRNFIFITIGCVEAERVLAKWDRVFRATFPDYERTILIYLEGRFALAGHETPLRNRTPDTDLLKNFKLGALLAPEFEISQFEKMLIALEGCAIYDGGKKGFEPVNHVREVLEFWERQLAYAESDAVPLWTEYNARFPLDEYFAEISSLAPGDAERLAAAKVASWEGLPMEDYLGLYSRFRWLWSPERIKAAMEPGSLARVCRKKISYLRSLIEVA